MSLPAALGGAHGACQSTIDNAPDDVIRELFAALDYRTIINFRQTCRRIYEISKTYSVRTYSKEFENWTHEEPIFSNIRKIKESYCTVTLVPGGRWLLAILDSPHSHLGAFDLDTEGVDKHVMIDHLFPSSDEAYETEMLVDVDKASSIPSFTLAICRRYDSAPRHRMRLWQLRLSADSRTLEVAAPSTPILDQQTYTPFGGVLNAEAGLLIQCGAGKLSSTLEIIDWKESTPTIHSKAAIALGSPDETTHTYFVAKTEMVLIVRFGFIALYDVPRFQGLPIQPLPKVSAQIHGLRWTFRYHQQDTIVSQPLYSSLGRPPFAIASEHNCSSGRFCLFTTFNLDTPPAPG
ncbi:hypothetical protein FRB95_006263 [Tulasnella sp. JGI-2019a]|nr:hypothetical protein FRB95_006263 [Tulasnella sp. JGI-2019a]